MPEVLLVILKILGFVLLGILGLIFLVILIVLFSPVRYQLWLRKKEDLAYDVKARWFLRFLNVRYLKKGDEEIQRLRVFWFYDIPKGEGILALLKKIWKIIGSFVLRTWQLSEDDDRVAAAIRLFFLEILRIIRYILPKKLTGSLEYGLGSPDKTGMSLAVLSMVLPVHPHFEVIPDFYESRFEGELSLGRHIFICVVLWHILKIVFGKNVLYTVKTVLRANKKEKKNGTVRT